MTRNLVNAGTNRLQKAKDASVDPAVPADVQARLEARAAQAAVPSVALPAPHEPLGDGEMNDQELAELALYERAIRAADWLKGKALDGISKARLYRATHDTFEAYVHDVWQISAPAAYRAIEQWPLAERVSPIGRGANERQLRALLPAAKAHGLDAASVLYGEIVATSKPTAAVVDEVVKLLPEQVPADETAQRDLFRQLLATRTAPIPQQSSQSPQSAAAADSSAPADPLALLRVLRKTLSQSAELYTRESLQAAYAADPQATVKDAKAIRAKAEAMRKMADELLAEHQRSGGQSLAGGGDSTENR